MLFSYKWLQSYLKKPLPPPNKLVEFLTIRAFEVEGISKVGKDYVLDIDVLPNRGSDCFSHIGMAREIAAIVSNDFQATKYKLDEDKKLKTKDFIALSVENKNDCFRYTGRIIVDVKVGSSPKWIQDRLKICGLRPINNIVDITNYVMLETGQPLHAFDFSKIESEIPNSQFPPASSGTNQIPNPLDAERTPLRVASQNSKIKTIIVRRAKKGEKIITLDNEKYDLDRDVLVIADSKEPLAIAGVKGGKKAEVDKGTKTIILESANFNAVLIHQISRELKLKTDASWRFEHKIDPNLTKTAIDIAAYLIQKTVRPQGAQPKIASGLIDFYPKKLLSKKIKLDLDYVEKLLGVRISEKKIRKILEKLGLKIVNCKLKILNVVVPTCRLDISLPEDLIEEIGRIYGLQNIPAIFPTAALIPPEKNFAVFWEREIKNILKELGFSEVYNYSFIGEKQAEVFGYRVGEISEIENPMSADQRYLRPSLAPNLLKNVKENFKYLDRIKIFELEKIFLNKKKAENKKEIIEKRMLTGLIARKNTKEESFYQLKGTIDSLFNKVGISDIWYDDYQQTPEESNLAIWRSDRSAEIKIGNEEIGFLGEIDSSILKNIGINGKIILFDIDFEKLTKLCSEEQEYQPISQYPAAVRDLSILVPAKVKVVDVLNKINTIGGSLIRDVDLFDIYDGEGLSTGKKSLAFHLIYQAKDRTLNTKEIDVIQNKIIKALEKSPEWKVRR